MDGADAPMVGPHAAGAARRYCSLHDLRVGPMIPEAREYGLQGLEAYFELDSFAT
ncbi:MAG TPA: hypothetical protein VIC86_02955 [Acidimicrobiales bacterium]